ncbi:hypothetical protein EVA_15503 [gut metagenome]|uniref:Uncharacterized protein n=1 Tax=gut metagenome TaxID=749906 RepID=J9FN69_9ZZZZ
MSVEAWSVPSRYCLTQLCRVLGLILSSSATEDAGRCSSTTNLATLTRNSLA